MNRSRSTTSSCTARDAHRPLLRSRCTCEKVKSAYFRVVTMSRGPGGGERRARRGAKARRWGGPGRTCSPAAEKPARAAPSSSCTFLDLDNGHAPACKSSPVSREVGRPGSLMRTRRGGSAPGARAAGGAGGAQSCWRVVQSASRGPSRVPSREGEWGEERGRA